MLEEDETPQHCTVNFFLKHACIGLAQYGIWKYHSLRIHLSTCSQSALLDAWLPLSNKKPQNLCPSLTWAISGHSKHRTGESRCLIKLYDFLET